MATWFARKGSCGFYDASVWATTPSGAATYIVWGGQTGWTDTFCANGFSGIAIPSGTGIHVGLITTDKVGGVGTAGGGFTLTLSATTNVWANILGGLTTCLTVNVGTAGDLIIGDPSDMSVHYAEEANPKFVRGTDSYSQPNMAAVTITGARTTFNIDINAYLAGGNSDETRALYVSCGQANGYYIYIRGDVYGGEGYQAGAIYSDYWMESHYVIFGTIRGYAISVSPSFCYTIDVTNNSTFLVYGEVHTSFLPAFCGVFQVEVQGTVGNGAYGIGNVIFQDTAGQMCEIVLRGDVILDAYGHITQGGGFKFDPISMDKVIYMYGQAGMIRVHKELDPMFVKKNTVNGKTVGADTQIKGAIYA